MKKLIIEMYKQKKNISREIAKKKKRNAKVDDNGLYGVLVIGYIRLHYTKSFRYLCNVVC